MRANTLREIWANGGSVINGWLSIPNTFTAELMSHQGWDSLTVDMQHGLVDYQAAVNMMTAISTTPTVPLVRVPWLEPGIVMKSLDAGAYGIICPMINTAEDAEKLVSATHYLPDGNRSFGPLRASLYSGSDYVDHANEAIVVFAMIETSQGLDNLDEILAVPHLDAIYIGPSDLSMALGCKPEMDNVEKPVAEAIDLICAKAREHGKIAGIHNASVETAMARVEKGFQFATVASDARLLAASAKLSVDRMRGQAHSAAADTKSSNGGYV